MGVVISFVCVGFAIWDVRELRILWLEGFSVWWSVERLVLCHLFAQVDECGASVFAGDSAQRVLLKDSIFC